MIYNLCDSEAEDSMAIRLNENDESWKEYALELNIDGTRIDDLIRHHQTNAVNKKLCSEDMLKIASRSNNLRS